MKSKASCVFLLWFLSMFCSLGVQARGGERSINQEERLPHWSYQGETGPAHWGELSEAFSLCNSGHLQSPIDIHGGRLEPLPSLSFQYRSSALTIVNSGHTVRVNYESGSYLRVGPERYQLKQFHFHTPGEHSIEGWRADMVIHLVHEDAIGNVVIVAVPVVAGRRHNVMLERLWEYLPKQPGESHYYRHVGIKPNFFIPSGRDYYTYTGSLTTPPCTEGVRWFVIKKPLEVSGELVERFRRVLGHNTRPIQAGSPRRVVVERR